jgi:hypothetical protein
MNMEYPGNSPRRFQPDLRLAAQPLLGTLILVGMSSQAGAPMLLYPAALLALYAALGPGGGLTLLRARGTWLFAGRMAARVGLFVLAIAAAGLLADGEHIVGVIGSLAFIAVLGMAAGAAGLIAWKAIPAVFRSAGRFASRRRHTLSHAIVLARLSLTIW